MIDPILKILFLTAENMFEKTGLDMQATGRFVRTGLDICTVHCTCYRETRIGLDMQATGRQEPD